MTAILLSVSIALTIVVGLIYGVARLLFREPIDFDPQAEPHGDMPYDGRRRQS